MIRLHARPYLPSPIRKFYLFLSLPVCRRSSLLAREGGGGGGGRGAESDDSKKLDPLYVIQSSLKINQQKN
jgi:hypothetical protein